MPHEIYCDYADLAVYLLPVPTALALGLWAIVRRRDAKHQAEIEAARDSRATERREMMEQREAFYDDIKEELGRISSAYDATRQLYQQEVERRMSLSTALAEAALREHELQSTIMTLTRKVDALQDEVASLRKELAARESWAQ